MKRALLAMPLLVALLASPGCGGPGAVSPTQYLERISELHDDVALGLGEAFASLSTLDYDDYYDLVEMQGAFEESREVFSTAEKRAGELSPPDEYRQLHQDLLLFYADGRERGGTMAQAVSFLEEVLLTLTEIENLALPDLPDAAAFEEIKSAAEEDLTTVGGYVDGLKGMEPPEDLLPLRDRLAELLRSLDESARAMDGAVTPEDSGPFLRFRQDFPAFLQAADGIWGEARSYLQGLTGSVDEVIERGKELAKRIPMPPPPPETGGRGRGAGMTGGRG